MVTGTATIRNDAGIHVRPSGTIYSAVRGYDGSIVVRYKDKELRALSLMGLIALGLAFGSEVELEVEGPDEQQKLEELTELFERRYDFPPRE